MAYMKDGFGAGSGGIDLLLNFLVSPVTWYGGYLPSLLRYLDHLLPFFLPNPPSTLIIKHHYCIAQIYHLHQRFTTINNIDIHTTLLTFDTTARTS